MTVDLGDDEIDQLKGSGYEIQHQVGRGTSGVVYLARQPRLDRDVALKRVAVSAQGGDTGIQRLQREISALVNLDHPGVVRLMDVLRFGGSMWFVMEYIDGPTLRTILDLSPRGLDPPDALRIVEDLAFSLDYVATRGVVHRDLKPANLFLTADGRCKVGDFGIALLRDPEDSTLGASRLTAPGVVVGTPAYMSPEQVSGSAEITTASDLYALGSIAFELFAGRPPFVGKGNVLALLLAQASDQPPRPSEFLPEASPQFDSALLAPLAKLPADRPSSPAAFWAELKIAADRIWPNWDIVSDPGSLSRRARLAPPPAAQVASDERATREEVFGDPVEPPEIEGFKVIGSPESPPPAARVVPPHRRSATWRRWLVVLAAFLIAVLVAFAIAKAVSTRKAGIPVDRAAVTSVFPPSMGSAAG